MEEMGLMRMVHDAARHAAARHAHIARNIANADTPGYRATDLTSFAETIDAPAMTLKTTRPGHVGDEGGAANARTFERTTEPAPNGNSVSLENEMLQATDVQNQHEKALSIYSSARDVLRTSLGRK